MTLKNLNFDCAVQNGPASLHHFQITFRRLLYTVDVDPTTEHYRSRQYHESKVLYNTEII